MCRVIKFFGIFIALSLSVLPATILAQDLGSSSGLFGTANTAKKNKSNEVRKSTATKKAVSRSVNKSDTRLKTSKNYSKAPKEAPAFARKSTPEQNNSAIPEDIIIKVGKTDEKSSAPAFEKIIEEGNTARDARNYPAAEAAYRRAQSLNPKDSRAIYGLGNLFADQQRWEEAEKAYRQALELEPDSPEANLALSFILTQPVTTENLGERYSEAEKLARRAIELNPKNAVVYDQLGAALELSGKIGAETQTAYRHAIELDPNFALAYAHLGRLLRRNGKIEESDAAYRDSIRLSIDVPTMILVADVMQSQQRYNESEQLLHRALRQDSKNPTALYLLGRALTTRGNFDEAERLLKRSVEVSPNSFVPYTLLSSVYVRRGNFIEAEKILMRAVTVVTANERKRLAQEFEIIGDGLAKQGRQQDAARVYRQAVALDGEKTNLVSKIEKAEKN